MTEATHITEQFCAAFRLGGRVLPGDCLASFVVRNRAGRIDEMKRKIFDAGYSSSYARLILPSLRQPGQLAGAMPKSSPGRHL